MKWYVRGKLVFLILIVAPIFLCYLTDSVLGMNIGGLLDYTFGERSYDVVFFGWPILLGVLYLVFIRKKIW